MIVSKGISLSEDEKSVLCMHTKFSEIQYLIYNDMEFEFQKEQAFAKVRMQRKKELEEMERRRKEEEEVEPPLLEIIETEKEKEDREEREEEEEARTRQTFEPQSKEYDDRNRRVTDLAECNRISLPKPPPIDEEALIEMRRGMYSNIVEKHMLRKLKMENKYQICLINRKEVSIPYSRGFALKRFL